MNTQGEVFEFGVPAKVVFGPGITGQIFEYLKGLGKKALIVTGSDKERAEKLLCLQGGFASEFFQVKKEPTIDDVKKGIKAAQAFDADMVISIGGGSVVDAGKAIAALLTNQGDIYDYLEVIGKGLPLLNVSLPFVAIPTTAGTGAEVTSNAVLKAEKEQVKVSLRSPFMFPTMALIDPVNTLSLPETVTISTGLDALTQLIEAFVSKNANPFTHCLCREGIRAVARSLLVVAQDGSNLEARSDMSLGALFSGIALSNAKLGAVHGFAAPMGGMFQVSHGMVCASLLGAVFQKNVSLCSAGLLPRFHEVAQLLTNNNGAKAQDAVTWILETCSILKVPTLKDMGILETDFSSIAQKAMNSSSMKGNPIDLSHYDLVDILKTAF